MWVCGCVCVWGVRGCICVCWGVEVWRCVRGVGVCVYVCFLFILGPISERKFGIPILLHIDSRSAVNLNCAISIKCQLIEITHLLHLKWITWYLQNIVTQACFLFVCFVLFCFCFCFVLLFVLFCFLMYNFGRFVINVRKTKQQNANFNGFTNDKHVISVIRSFRIAMSKPCSDSATQSLWFIPIFAWGRDFTIPDNINHPHILLI